MKGREEERERAREGWARKARSTNKGMERNKKRKEKEGRTIIHHAH